MLILGLVVVFIVGVIIVRYVRSSNEKESNSGIRVREFELRDEDDDKMFAEDPYGSAFPGVDHVKVHKLIINANSCWNILSFLAESAFKDFPTIEEAYRVNRNWMLKHCPPFLGYLSGVLFDDNEMRDKYDFNSDDKGRIIFELCQFCDKPHVRKELERLGPSDYDHDYNFKSFYAEPLYAKKNLEMIRFVQQLLPKVKVDDPNELRTGVHTDYNFGCSNSNWTLLSKAVDADDFELVGFLLQMGADPNVYLHSFWNRDPNTPTTFGDPVILHVKSQRVFNLMANSGMELYPVRGSLEEIENRTGEMVSLTDQLDKWRKDWEFLHV